MKKELKKYIKENLKKSKKNSIFCSAYCSSLSLKSIFFVDDDVEEIDDKPIIIAKEESSKDESIKKIYDYEENDDFNPAETIDMELDIDVPPFLRKWQSEEETNKDIKKYLNKHHLSNFQKTLFRMIDERNLKDSDVYNKVHIDRRLFSKIRNDKKYHPSKETIILLGLSLELSITELEELLNSASYSLPKTNHYDLIIRFCFINKIYRIIDVNDLLDEYNCELFDY